MKDTLIILFILLSFGKSSGQDQIAIDSLKAQLQEATEDSVRVQCLYNLGGAFYKYSLDSVLFYSRKIEEIAQSSGDLDFQALANHHFGSVFINQSKYQEAIALAEENIQHYTNTDQERKSTTSHFNLAIAYSELGDLEKSATHYFVVLDHYQVAGDTRGVAHVYNGLGITYETFKEFDKAVEYYRRGLALLGPEHDDGIDRASLSSNLGELYLTLGQIDSAKHYILEAKRINNLLEMDWGLGYSHAILSAIALAEDQPDQSLDHALASMAYRKTSGTPAEMGWSHLVLGRAYVAGAKLKLAEESFLQALNSGQDVNLALVEQAADALAKLYEENQHYDESLQYYRIQNAAKDSLLQKDKLIALNSLQYKYDASQKEKEITEKELKIQKQNQLKTYLISGLIILSLITLFIYYRFQKNRALSLQELQLQKGEIMSLQKEKQLDAVTHELQVINAMLQGVEEERTRIARDLHDGVGNQLTSLKMAVGSIINQIPAYSKEWTGFSQMVDETQREVRSIAHNMMPISLQKLGLPVAIKELCRRQNLGAGPLFSFESSGEYRPMTKEDEVVIYRIVQEVVQNILNHAQATEAVIEIKNTENAMHLEIRDNGIGWDSQQKSYGIGLSNISSRVEYLGSEWHLDTQPGEGSVLTFRFDAKNLSYA